MQQGWHFWCGYVLCGGAFSIICGTSCIFVLWHSIRWWPCLHNVVTLEVVERVYSYFFLSMRCWDAFFLMLFLWYRIHGFKNQMCLGLKYLVSLPNMLLLLEFIKIIFFSLLYLANAALLQHSAHHSASSVAHLFSWSQITEVQIPRGDFSYTV